MSWLAGYLRSSVGAKHIMAVTGLGLLLFAIVHMLGHLQMFGGPSMYNAYANFLQNLWEVKWPVRFGLLGLLLVHVVVAIGLVARNRAARPVGYVKFKTRTSSIVGRTMAITGLFVFAFLAFHILHFTAGQIQPQYFHVPQHGGTDVRAGGAYGMFVPGFRQPWVYGIYLAGIALLSSHLGHGAASWMQSLGLRHPKYPADKLGPAIAVFLFVGYMVPPTAVLLGAIR
jgi:succinate dehydrogenase / fumarate reductase cytochrome b subunit